MKTCSPTSGEANAGEGNTNPGEGAPEDAAEGGSAGALHAAFLAEREVEPVDPVPFDRRAVADHESPA